MKEKFREPKQDKDRLGKLLLQLDAMFGCVDVADFGPIKLKQFRDTLVQRGLSGGHINRLTRAAEKAGVKPWSPYRLRHLCATHVRAACGLYDTKALLGHCSSLS